MAATPQQAVAKAQEAKLMLALAAEMQRQGSQVDPEI